MRPIHIEKKVADTFAIRLSDNLGKCIITWPKKPENFFPDEIEIAFIHEIAHAVLGELWESASIVSVIRPNFLCSSKINFCSISVNRTYNQRWLVRHNVKDKENGTKRTRTALTFWRVAWQAVERERVQVEVQAEAEKRRMGPKEHAKRIL